MKGSGGLFIISCFVSIVRRWGYVLLWIKKDRMSSILSKWCDNVKEVVYGNSKKDPMIW